MWQTIRSFIKITQVIAVLGIGPAAYGHEVAHPDLNISANGNLHYQNGINFGRFSIREFEVVLSSQVPPYFEAYLNLAAHQDSVQLPLFEVHECYALNRTWMTGGEFKAGHFFLGVGLLNKLHWHDWPFISAPQSHQNFFAPEAVTDTGFEATIPFTPSFKTTLGITNGWYFGHTHSVGSSPQIPTHYVRLVMSDSSQNFAAGVNYLANKNFQAEGMQLLGLDLSVQRWGKTRWFSEHWLRIRSSAGVEPRYEVGGYLFPNISISEKWSFGPRFDYLTDLSRTLSNGARVRNVELALVPTVTYAFSERSTMRGHVKLNQVIEDLAGPYSTLSFELQWIFMLADFEGHSGHSHSH